MPQNIEVKAKIDNPEQLHKIAGSITDIDVQIVQQEDIFFQCTTGRLKLRILSPTSGELIFYQRENHSGPKSSTYNIAVTSDPSQLRAVLANAYGESIIVRKIRHLYCLGRTRIHIDKVEELGDFLELEVVLNETDNLTDAKDEARALMEKLKIIPSDLIDVAYADLLTQTQ